MSRGCHIIAKLVIMDSKARQANGALFMFMLLATNWAANAAFFSSFIFFTSRFYKLRNNTILLMLPTIN